MMGPEESPAGVDLDANMLPCSAAALAYPISKVLDDDNLLIEIIVRLGFPTSLVRVALVCKRWYNHASNRAFLRRFRKLHPPRLLGFYVNTQEELNPDRFVPMLPRPLELNSVFRHARFSCDAYKNGRPYVMDCGDNSVLIRFHSCDGAREPVQIVYSPLFPERGMAIVPPSPRHQRLGVNGIGAGHLLIKRGDNLCYFYVFIKGAFDRTESTVHIYKFQDGVWCMITSSTAELPGKLLVEQRPLLVDNKIYIVDSNCSILVFDLTALSFSRIQLPQGVVFGHHFFSINPLGLECGGRTMLSRADDDLGVYLIHVNELQLVIWLHEGDNWLLVDTICLQEMCADLRISDWRFENGNNGFVVITMVGPMLCLCYCRRLYSYFTGISSADCCVKCTRSEDTINFRVIPLLL